MTFRRALCLLIMSILLLGVASATTAYAQEASMQDRREEATHRSALSEVEQGFGDGDARRLLTSGAERIEISVFGARTFYSRSQALYVMSDFFEEYAPRRFELDQASQTARAYFASGRYWHMRSDRPLRVYVRLGKDRSEWRLYEIRIEQKPR